MALLTVRHLTYRTAQDSILLRDVSLQVEQGTIMTILGPSGSGKSTLLRSLNRLIEPPPNTVFLHESDITSLPVIELRRQIGMMFQTAALFDGTVAANLRYGPSLHGRALDDATLSRLMQQVDLPVVLLSRSAATLSGGQAQRVALARALANDPLVLLLDEPTSALDPAATLMIERLVTDLCRRHKLTFVWVTHNVEQARRVGDTTLLLIDGAVADCGPTDHLLAADSQHHLVQRFARGESVGRAAEMSRADPE